MREEGFIVPDDFFNDNQRFVFPSPSSWLPIGESENSPLALYSREFVSSIRKLHHGLQLMMTQKTRQTAKRQKLEGRSDKLLQEANRFGPCSDQQLLKGLYRTIPKQTLNGPFVYSMSGQRGDVLLVQMMLFPEIFFFLAMLSGFLCSSSKLGRKMEVGNLPMQPR